MEPLSHGGRSAVTCAHAFIGKQVPFVDHHYQPAADLPGQAGDVGVLGGGLLRGVGHQDRNIAAVHRANGPDHAVFLDSFGYLAGAADAGGVDHYNIPSVVSDLGVQGVSGGAGHVADDGPFLPQDGIQQAGFAHVGPAYDGQVQRPMLEDRSGVIKLLKFLVHGRRVALHVGGDPFHQAVDAIVVEGADGLWVAHAQAVELWCAKLPSVVVHLVDS